MINFQFSIFPTSLKLRRASNFQKSRAGFTLVEAIVAIGVISVGFVGSLVLISKSSAQASILKDRVVAAHLAAEGLEVVHNIRDTNWLKGFPWRTGLDDTSNGTVNYNSTGVTNSDNQCLNWDGSTYFHTYTITCSTSFRRHIELATKSETIAGNNVSYLEVKSIMEWKEKSLTHSLTVIDHLYDWK